MANLSHAQVRTYLQADHASLTSDEQAAVNEHLRDCDECRAYADYLTRLRAALTQTLHQRWDEQPVPKIAPRVLPRLRKSKLPQQMFNFAISLGALAALILFLQAFFTAQRQPTAQSPLATESPLAGATITPPLVPAVNPVTPVAARPTPTPIQIALLDAAAIKVSRVSFWPDQSVVFDRNVASGFGLEMEADATINTTVHMVAYGLRPNEAPPDCLTRSVPVDRPFWANQADYAAGAITFNQRFTFRDEGVGADRFAVRLNVLDTTNDRLLYCTQQVYAVAINVTPAPPTPAPAYPATPTPYDVSPTPPPPTATPDTVPGTPWPTSTPYAPPPTPTPYSVPGTPWPTSTPYDPPPTPTPYTMPGTPGPTSTPYAPPPTPTPYTVPGTPWPTSTPYTPPPMPTPIGLTMTPTA